MILKRINTDLLRRYNSVLENVDKVKDYTTNDSVKSSVVARDFGRSYRYGIVGIEKDEFVLGFFSITPNKFESCVMLDDNVGRSFNIDVMDIESLPKENYAFHNGVGYYVVSNNPDIVTKYMDVNGGNKYGCGLYPYKTIARRYSANESLSLFENQQVDIKEESTNQRKALKYTFGMEFETSGGFIPEHLCYKYGLIPLRDGSIKGVEYSTIVLNNAKGLSLLKEQIKLLDKYTIFDKDCSLHMHLGGYPIEPVHIFVLDVLGNIIQDSLEQYIPYWTFTSENYKSSHKNYCRKLQGFDTFHHLYYAASNGTRYLGSLQQPHPNDNNRNAKWNIGIRYVWQNIVNMMFYRGCKTVEYRFLRPTYNFNKIINWLYIFNALLQFAEIVSKTLLKKYTNNALDNVTYGIVKKLLQEDYNISNGNADNLMIIINAVYKSGPAGVLDILIDFLDCLKFISSTQKENDDFCGGISHLDKIIYRNVLNE